MMRKKIAKKDFFPGTKKILKILVTTVGFEPMPLGRVLLISDMRFIPLGHNSTLLLPTV